MPFTKDLDTIHPVEVKECNMAFFWFLFWRSLFTGKERVAVVVPRLVKKVPGLKLES